MSVLIKPLKPTLLAQPFATKQANLHRTNAGNAEGPDGRENDLTEEYKEEDHEVEGAIITESFVQRSEPENVRQGREQEHRHQREGKHSRAIRYTLDHCPQTPDHVDQ